MGPAAPHGQVVAWLRWPDDEKRVGTRVGRMCAGELVLLSNSFLSLVFHFLLKQNLERKKSRARYVISLGRYFP